MATLSFTGISKSLSSASRTNSASSKTIRNISTSISNRTTVRKNLYKNILQYKNRREENESRQIRQDSISNKLQILSPRNAKSLSLRQIGGSFSSRILGFFAFTTAGWLLSNMPTWIAGAKELTLRVQSLDSTFSGFVNDIRTLIDDIGKLSNAFYKNLISFDFSDDSKLVANSMMDLSDTFGDMADKIGEAFDVLTKPFQNVPPLGSEGEDGAYPPIQPPGQPAEQPSESMGNADFWTLVAIVATEDGDPQGQADVAQSIYNRAAAGVFPGGNDIKKIIVAERQYQPTRERPRINPSGKTNREWYLINSPETAARATGFEVDAIKNVAKNITNPTLQKKAAEYIENRTDFVSSGSATPSNSTTEIKQRNAGDNKFGNFVGPASRKYGSESIGKPSPIPGQITPSPRSQQPPRPSPSSQSGFTSVFNFEVHHPAANEGKRSGLMESVTYQPNEVTRAFIREFGSYSRGFGDKGAPKRGLNILEVADEKGVDYNAQKIFKVIKQFPNVFFNMFAGHSDVPNLEGMETGAEGKSGIHEQIFNPKVCEKVMQLCNAAGLNNIKYRLPLGKPTSGTDPKSNWSYSERLIKEFRPGTSSSRPTPSSQQSSSSASFNPNKTYRVNEKVSGTRGVEVIITSRRGMRNGIMHGGIDIAMNSGTYVACKYPIRIVEARSQDASNLRVGYGYYVDIIVDALAIRLRLAHLSGYLFSGAPRDEINGFNLSWPAGKSFVRSGNSGRSTAPHIHLEATKSILGSAYGGYDENYKTPDPYVDIFIYSSKPINESQANITSTPSSSLIPAPSTTLLQTPEGTATIDSTSSSSLDDILKGLSAERSGQQIVLINYLQPPQQPTMISSGGGSQIIMSDESNLVNNFIKNKLLLDLSYL